MDYLEGGMVLDSLINCKECRYTEDDARGVFKQVLEGLLYLHQRYDILTLLPSFSLLS